MGEGKKSLAAAEQTLEQLKALVDGSRMVEGKLSQATIKKTNKLLLDSLDGKKQAAST